MPDLETEVTLGKLCPRRREFHLRRRHHIRKLLCRQLQDRVPVDTDHAVVRLDAVLPRNPAAPPRVDQGLIVDALRVDDDWPVQKEL